ncbi:MAG TPA: hypothetical protein VMB81_02880, partial [Candidatus Sulfotelmatobacter sp.]|nr:hypothetical protein [Candidatus Sulfotelmatobacter sp.]
MADAAEDPVALAAALPRARRDDALYLACRDYVARCDGTGNSDMATNGELALLSATIPSCRVVFDVGAHTGDWTAAALALNPALVVHAFEPSARNAAALRARNFPAGVMRSRVVMTDRRTARCRRYPAIAAAFRMPQESCAAASTSAGPTSPRSMAAGRRRITSATAPAAI